MSPDAFMPRVNDDALNARARIQGVVALRATATAQDSRSVARAELPVERWLAGARRASIRVPTGAWITRVEIDPEKRFAYVRREGHVWTR